MESTIIASVAGGLLIGLSATLLLLMNGKVAGISGILKKALYNPLDDKYWRWFFIAGLIGGGVVAHQALNIPHPDNSQSYWLAAIAGLLVGIGTKVANGCTSGHGVCGIGRRSIRSLVATLVFMATAIATVFIGKHFS